MLVNKAFGNPAYMEINQEIGILKLQTQDITNTIKQFAIEQETCSPKLYEFQKNRDNLRKLQQQQPQTQENMFVITKLSQQTKFIENYLSEKASDMLKYLTHALDLMKEQYNKLSLLISHVLDYELITWKRNQQLAGNGCDFDTSQLDVLQAWCEGLADIIWVSITQMKELKGLISLATDLLGNVRNIVENLYTLGRKLTELLSTIVTNTFIIEKQPPQVMKTNTRFSAKVRYLVGGKLNVHINPPVVKVSIISEQQANMLLSENIPRGDAIGDIQNNTGTMEYNQEKKQLAIEFKNMQLKKIKRAEKKGSESVVDEKFSLFFSSNFVIGGELEFQVWTLSLPVTVIVHGNQEPHAWATITWDNAFAEPGRKPFVVPDKVHWGKVANALNLKFNAVTGRPLTKDNLNYLAEKLFRMQIDEYDTQQLSWASFSKDSLVDRNFTFWDWFYAIMKLTREHLKQLWIDGSILGFVPKKQAEDMLISCPSGTFLLRFSDSELGGITVALVRNSGDKKEVIMLQPFTAKDFGIRSLADRLNDLEYLLYLYPDIPKKKAFSRYYTPFTNPQYPSVNGYVKPMLVTHVPLLSPQTNSQVNGAMVSEQSYLDTPQPMFQHNSPGNTSFTNENSNNYDNLIVYGGMDDLYFQ